MKIVDRIYGVVQMDEPVLLDLMQSAAMQRLPRSYPNVGVLQHGISGLLGVTRLTTGVLYRHRLQPCGRSCLQWTLSHLVVASQRIIVDDLAAARWLADIYIAADDASWANFREVGLYELTARASLNASSDVGG